MARLPKQEGRRQSKDQRPADENQRAMVRGSLLFIRGHFGGDDRLG